ncbi:glutathione S-transferase family protein [Halomonas urumqiensis]|uniref:Glutathione S-transferase n=1 Tax=Halomonas urumqiensis TaxID=1684789 RepID=A0A2N7UKA2_9GAMM|nr:glutathione S-transferase family protein [Halomonas urumqiensis]PMR80842.1 glutathione S-transferase [Halomonas urumqiensis]PTB02799.1 glutathione S-transferase family protein [Halomonas urumqiensis]GHE21306.1 glutathione S-transferase [Halomonas urumqiensis]
MITLYSFPSSRSLRVAWTLEELGLEYACQHVDLAAGQGRAAEHLARHPDGKVPAIQEDDLTLFESGAICRYLAERHGEPGHLLPAAAAERALVDQWLFFVVGELEQPLWTQGKHKFALPRDKRVPAVLPTAAWEFQRALSVLQSRLAERDWLVGSHFTLADLMVAHTLSWAVMFKHRLPDDLEAYRQRCQARPALARAVERERQAAESSRA